MNPRCLLLPLLLLALPAAAQLPPHEVAVSLGRWDSSELGNAPTIGASYKRFFGRMFSTGVGGFISRDLSTNAEVTAGALHVSGELHLFRAARVSPWVGAGGAYAYQRKASSTEHFVGSETRMTGIYSGGVDVAVSPRFAVGAEVSYMNYEVMLGSRYGYRVDPVTMLLSGRWRF